MTPFEQALAKLSLIEGGYTLNPNETYRGIDRARAGKSWEGWARIDALKEDAIFPANIEAIDFEESVTAFYRKNFWDVMRLDDVSSISELIALEMFDTYVNTGVAGRFVQRELNALNRQQRDYPDIIVDGSVGPATLAALRTFLATRGALGEVVLLVGINAQLHQHYLELVEGRQKDEEFFFGWVSQRVTREVA